MTQKRGAPHLDIGMLAGLVAGIGLIVAGIVINGGQVGSFLEIGSLMIVAGGTLASAMINFKARQVAGIFQLVRVALFGRQSSPRDVIRMLVRFAETARRDGLLAMEEEAEELEDPFLRKGIRLVVDGADPETVRQILDIELAFLEERHRSGQQLFEYMGAMAPAFGMLGTVIGLIIMLGNLDDPETIGPAMAVALITTLYGVIFANLIFLPIAGRLRVKSEEEIVIKEMMIEGILSIQAGENPYIVEQKLESFLAPAARLEIDEQEDQREADRRPGVVAPSAR